MSNNNFTFLKFLKNVGIMAAIGIACILFFFYIYLPSTTNHRETITIPELVGMSFSDINEFVTQRNLRFEIVADSGYSEALAPLTILTQNPKAGSKVKENRKIYLSLNATVPPKVRMPNLINTTRLNAEDVLKGNGLKLGEIEYVESLELNAVLFQRIDGEDVPHDAFVPKGSKIDLVIGDGLGNQSFETPDFTGQSLDEAQFQIGASKLVLDIINYIKNDTLPDNLRNRIYYQLPPAGRKTSSGGNIEIWINSDPPEDNQTGEIKIN